jgi:hypothetical protein
MVTIAASPDGFPRGRPATFSCAAHVPPDEGRCAGRLGPDAGTPARLAGVTVPPTPDELRICSARGCREPARYALAWNNPRLHDPQRRKIWLACETHRETLAGFLSARGFLRETDPL